MVEWILVTLPNEGPHNFDAFVNHLKPTPSQETSLKKLIITLLNEEDKRKERKRTRPYHQKRDRDFKKPKATSNSANITHEVNALKTRLDTKSNIDLTEGNSCFIWNKIMQTSTLDQNYHKGRGKGARPKKVGTTKVAFKKSFPKKEPKGSDDDEPDYRINAI
ncbi:unnamed protein product, partial [Aphanomyces euteiches]